MTTAQSAATPVPKPLRVWPGLTLAAVQVLTWFVLPKIFPDQGFSWFLATVVAGLAIILWWIFFSRAPWLERLGLVLLLVVAVYVGSRMQHVSVATAGMGFMYYMFAVLLATFVLAVGAAVGRRFAPGPRRALMATLILLACFAWTLFRTEGVTGEGTPQLAWRWTPTPEEKLLAQAGSAPAPSSPAPVATETPKEQPAALPAAEPAPKPAAPAPESATAETRAEWPGFRGPERNSIISGVRVNTDWTAAPPVEVWRRPIGPGWSSFAVSGDLFYTQEQRGEEELVACYRVSTGELVWAHRDVTRFWESNGGAGPRATPTLSNGRVYSFGATGILNVLDAATGAVVWSRNVATEADVKVPTWGFAGSPLVLDDKVIVAAAGKLAAYDLATGNPRWFGPKGGGGYSSPQLLNIGGVAQIVLLSGSGATSVAPADGAVLWEHKWDGDGIVQPGVTGDGDVLLGSGSGMAEVGMRRIGVARGANGWTVAERWTSIALKPYFNDYVIHKGHAFGFDGGILASVDLKDGKRKWKGGRYGHGQLMLLADQELLLVMTEEGELALVRAATDQFTEIARAPAIEGKTWNHPVLVRDLVLVRNDREMAAFRLSLARR